MQQLPTSRRIDAWPRTTVRDHTQSLAGLHPSSDGDPPDEPETQGWWVSFFDADNVQDDRDRWSIGSAMFSSHKTYQSGSEATSLNHCAARGQKSTSSRIFVVKRFRI